MFNEEAVLSISAGSREALPLALSGNTCAQILRVTLFG